MLFSQRTWDSPPRATESFVEAAVSEIEALALERSDMSKRGKGGRGKGEGNGKKGLSLARSTTAKNSAVFIGLKLWMRRGVALRCGWGGGMRSREKDGER